MDNNKCQHIPFTHRTQHRDSWRGIPTEVQTNCLKLLASLLLCFETSKTNSTKWFKLKSILKKYAVKPELMTTSEWRPPVYSDYNCCAPFSTFMKVLLNKDHLSARATISGSQEWSLYYTGLAVITLILCKVVC